LDESASDAPASHGRIDCYRAKQAVRVPGFDCGDAHDPACTPRNDECVEQIAYAGERKVTRFQKTLDCRKITLRGSIDFDFLRDGV
jgi:hypothetical protein